MSPSKDPQPKIAMKGFSLSKSSTSNKPGAKPTPASSLGKRPRSTFTSHNSDSDSDSNDERVRGRHEAVIAFGESGAVKQSEKKSTEPLVIPKLGNRDWRGEARSRIGERAGGRNLLPAEVQAARREANGNRAGKVEGVDVVNSKDGEVQWGLSVRKKEETPPELENGATETDIDGAEDKVKEMEQEPTKPKTMDEEALEALLGNRKEKKGPDLVIPAAVAGHEEEGPISETDAYRRAIASAPDVSTLEDYERVPVEEFGAALLRGMGWKGPSADGKTGGVKQVKRRQNLLGLGAKELKDAEELGAWVQKSDVKRLNGGSDRRPEKRPKASEYRREKERRDEKREERGGGSYRRDRERDRDGGRGERDYRDRDRERYRDRRR